MKYLLEKLFVKHTCHWPGCEKQVPPRLWGCRQHWFRLPARYRKLISSLYVPGQEITKTPTREYVTAAIAVREWCLAEIEKEKNEKPEGFPE